MVTVAQLRAFSAVAQCQHFTRAAEQLQIAQPSVSYQVHALERELKVQLVELDGRQVYLTDAGERLAVRVAAVLNDLDDIGREMQDYGAGALGRVRVGASRTVGSYALPPVLAKFHEAHPSIELMIRVDNTRMIELDLLGRKIDVAILEGRVTSPNLEVCPVRRDALVLIAAPDHPFAKCSPIRREDLRGQAFVVRELGSGTRALAEDALGPVARETFPVLELDQPEAIVRAVEAGMGLAFISEVIVERAVATGRLAVIQIEDMDLGREFSIVTLRGRSHSPAIKALAAFVTQEWKR